MIVISQNPIGPPTTRSTLERTHCQRKRAGRHRHQGAARCGRLDDGWRLGTLGRDAAACPRCGSGVAEGGGRTARERERDRSAIGREGANEDGARLGRRQRLQRRHLLRNEREGDPACCSQPSRVQTRWKINDGGADEAVRRRTADEGQRAAEHLDVRRSDEEGGGRERSELAPGSCAALRHRQHTKHRLPEALAEPRRDPGSGHERHAGGVAATREHRRARALEQEDGPPDGEGRTARSHVGRIGGRDFGVCAHAEEAAAVDDVDGDEAGVRGGEHGGRDVGHSGETSRAETSA
mmetsp:Transcript_42471/g.138201  ORF Transcript_42471/g.138201 Transcript_42471/m.138201 type:complete len:295 (+) Transcript_42471:87-971(+)